MFKNWLPSGIVRLLALDIEVVVSYFIVLVILLISAIYQVKVKNSTAFNHSIRSSLSLIFSKIEFHLPTLNASRLGLYIVWGIIGVLAYVVILWLMNTYNNIYNDVESSSEDYHHPSGFKKSTFWARIISQELIKVVALVLLVFYLILWLKTISPALVRLSKPLFVKALAVHSLTNFILFLIYTFLSIYLIAILLRIIAPKYFHPIIEQ